MRCKTLTVLVACLALPAAALAQSAQSSSETRDPAGLQRLAAQSGGAAVVSVHQATGGARFVRLQPGAVQGLAPGAAASLAAKQERSRTFFQNYAALLGISAGSTMQFVGSRADAIGETHLTWQQTYRNVPVFGGIVRTHFGRDGLLKAVAGTAVPDLAMNAAPSIPARRAADAARSAVASERGNPPNLRTGTVRLYVFREGLAQGVPGENHLVWEVEVTDGAGIRDLLYVDAHTGKVVDQIDGIHDEMRRRAYDGHDLAFAPENYPHGVYWQEGQAYPTASIEANNMIEASKEVYDFFNGAFGRDSFDDDGTPLDAIFDRGYNCPNASWNGVFISFCPGYTTDDVTAHEWGHAYTQYTHNLIYQWQSGALNESYSDIWGEVVDRLNTRGTDVPNAPRTASCSAFSPAMGRLQVNSPASIAGVKVAQSAGFGPRLTSTGVTEDVVVTAPAEACTTLTNAAQVAGKIALIARGTCEFSTKVLRAQEAGAIGAIITNNQTTGLPGMGPGVDAPRVTIPSLGILKSDGDAIRAVLGTTPPTIVNATLRAEGEPDPSLLWLMGEDVATTDATGALRDMYNPNCYGDPGKVSDTLFYVCSTDDGGGVHTNSGIPNHAFALLVDGGTYNGVTVNPIGLTKAAHIYFRAQSEYQVPYSNFVDHADALEQSCSDLLGQSPAPLGSDPFAGAITAADCSAVSAAIAAVELRAPQPCTFARVLRSPAPAQCDATQTTGMLSIFTAGFESSADGFTATTIPTGATFAAREWTRVSDAADDLPSPNTGWAFFAPEPDASCDSGDDSGVLQLTSPEITLPAATAFARATFEHWLATEPRWDGGNLKVSVNGGPWQLVPPSAYTFNGYNTTLLTAAQGNTNPMAGQAAWSGNDNGTNNGGSWGRTHVNLAGFAGPNDTVQLRWEFGTDVCAGRTGWYLDNVQVFSCTPNVPAISVNDPTPVEGDAGTRVVTFTVSLNKPTIKPVSVNYTIIEGSATHSDDFMKVDDGVLVIPAGRTTGTIGITLKGDIVVEADETLSVSLSSPVNATIAKASGTMTIVNDDERPTPPQP